MTTPAPPPGTRQVQCKQCLAMTTVPDGTDPHSLTWCGCCTQDHHHGEAAAACSPEQHDGGLTAPPVPASGTAVPNETGHPVAVTITGGDVTGIGIGGTEELRVSAVTAPFPPLTVPAGGSISLIYEQAPAWTWALPCWNPPGVPKPDGCKVCRPVIHFGVTGARLA